MPAPIMKYFEFAHLPAKLQEVSEPCSNLAQAMDTVLPDGPEKSAGLRKLLEAKDCFVRAQLSDPEPPKATTFKERVMVEAGELDVKMTKLREFTHTPVYEGLPQEEKKRLDTQYNYMCGYHNILRERIANF